LQVLSPCPRVPSSPRTTGQICSGCQLYTGKPGDAAGPCAILADKGVAAKGWCSANSKRARIGRHGCVQAAKRSTDHESMQGPCISPASRAAIPGHGPGDVPGRGVSFRAMGAL
jgi:hypothetical protein